MSTDRTVQLAHFWKGPAAKVIASLAMVTLTVAVLARLIIPQANLLADSVAHLRWHYIALSFFVYSADLALVALVWSQIVDLLGKRLSFARQLRYFCLANVAKRLPGTVWYVASRGLLYRSEDVGMGVVSVASGIEFFVAFISGLICVLLFAIPQIPANVAPWLLLGGCAGTAILLAQPRALDPIVRRLQIQGAQRISRRHVLRWMLIYVAAWLVGGAVLYTVASALTVVDVGSLPYILGSWALAGVISTLFFFFPSNWGVTEISLALLLSAIMPPPIAGVVAILMRLLVTAYELIWALLFLALGYADRRKIL